jgi:hypothetical protein
MGRGAFCSAANRVWQEPVLRCLSFIFLTLYLSPLLKPQTPRPCLMNIINCNHVGLLYFRLLVMDTSRGGTTCVTKCWLSVPFFVLTWWQKGLCWVSISWCVSYLLWDTSMHTQKPCSGGTIELNHIVYISTTDPLNTLLWLLCILAFSLTSYLKSTVVHSASTNEGIGLPFPGPPSPAPLHAHMPSSF